MDELQISGKRYLSSRRIAKENGYHTDYIGQLIRGGKVKGQKVGRTWYVEAGSFESYLGKEPAAASMPAQPQPIENEPIASTPVVAETVVAPVALEVPHVPAPVSYIEEDIKTETVAESAPEQPVAVKHVVVEVAPQIEQKPVPELSAQEVSVPITRLSSPAIGLRYVPEHESLIPEISRNNNVTRVMPKEEVVHAQTKPNSIATARSPRRSGVMVGFALIGVAVFVFSAVVSRGLTQTINVKADNSASASYTIEW